MHAGSIRSSSACNGKISFACFVPVIAAQGVQDDRMRHRHLSSKAYRQPLVSGRRPPNGHRGRAWYHSDQESHAIPVEQDCLRGPRVIGQQLHVPRSPMQFEPRRGSGKTLASNSKSTRTTAADLS